MAKQLDKSTIVSLGIVRPGHVSQSVDAFTGIDAYDITVSGSFTVTGPTQITGSLTTKMDSTNTVQLIGSSSNIQYLPDSVGGYLLLQGTTSGVPRMAVTIPSSSTKPSTGFAFGMRAWNDPTYPGYGKVGDAFFYAGNEANGVNFINTAGTGTEDYIRFYAGNNASNLSDIHIQGTGGTKGYVGIGTENPTEKLEVNGDVKATTFIGNLNGTASWADNTSTSSYAISSSYSENAASSSVAQSSLYALSSSYSVSSSYSENTTSSSYALSSSYADNSISSSYALNAGSAVSSSYATSSSYALNSTSASIATTSSYALTASYVTGGSNASGSNNYVPKFSGSTYLTNSEIYDNGTEVLVGTAGSAGAKLYVVETRNGYNAGQFVAYGTGIPLYASNVFTGDLLRLVNITGSVFSVKNNGDTTITGSLTVTKGITGSLAGTASYALTASYYDGSVVSSSYALSSSYAVSASYAPNTTFPYTGSAIITGSLIVTGSTKLYNSGSTVLEVSGSNGALFTITDDLTGDLFTVQSGSINLFNISSSGVTVLSGSLTATNGFTGSLLGTASYATNSLSSSYALTASYYNGSVVSSSYALSSSYATNSLSSSFALTASYYDGSVVSSSYALSSSYATNSLSSSFATSASYAANGGVTQLFAGPNITLSPTTGVGQVTISSTGAGTYYNTSTGSYGSFYDTTTQTNPVANIPRSMSLNTTDITNGVSISGSSSPFNTYIKIANAGIYNIQFSAQLAKTDSGTDFIDIWLRRNGVDLMDSATNVTLIGNNDRQVAAWNWFATAGAGDYYQIMWASADTNTQILAESATGVHPGIPSVIATVNRIDTFLSNTGSFSGSFTGVLNGTASYAVNALSSSYAVSASYAPDTTFPYTGSAIITGSLTVTGSTTLYNSGSTVLSVSGSQGTLFTVDDVISGDIFTVYSGSYPILNVNSNTTVTVSGSMNISSSLTINDIITIQPRTTTPSSGTFSTGSVIMSGSAGTVKPYYFDGSSWVSLI